MLDIAGFSDKNEKMKKERNTTTILTGRVILLHNDKVILSPMYVGKAYPGSNGEELISQLSQVYSEKHFRKYIERFSRREYGYFEADELFTLLSLKDFTENGIIDFNKLKYEKNFLADWLYFKNIGRWSVKMIFKDGHVVVLESRDTLATRTGYAIPAPLRTILKTKDTIKSITLIEKIN